jgi:hypothetical protein
MYGEKDDQKPGALKRLAKAKAAKKMSSASKVGKRLDRLEMMDAPRRPFLQPLKPSYGKGKPGKRIEMKDAPTPREKKIKDLARGSSKPVMPSAKPRLMKKGNK